MHEWRVGARTNRWPIPWVEYARLATTSLMHSVQWKIRLYRERFLNTFFPVQKGRDYSPFPSTFNQSVCQILILVRWRDHLSKKHLPHIVALPGHTLRCVRLGQIEVRASIHLWFTTCAVRTTPKAQNGVSFPLWVAWVLLRTATVSLLPWPIFWEVSHWWKRIARILGIL